MAGPGGPPSYIENNKGIFYPLHSKTTTCPTYRESPTQISFSRIRHRNREIDLSESFGIVSVPSRLSFQNVPGIKTRRQSSSNNKFTRVEQVPAAKEISPVEPLSSARIPSRRRLSFKDRYFTGIFSHTGEIGAQKILSDRSSSENIPVRLSTLRFSDGSHNVCTGIKLGGGTAQRKRFKSDSLPRRFSVSQSERGRLKRAHALSGQFSEGFGMDHKREKITESSYPLLRIFRTEVGHKKQQDFITRQKDCVVEERSRSVNNDRDLELGQREESGRKAHFCIFRCSSGKASFKASSTRSKPLTRKSEESQIYYSKESHKGNFLVVSKPSKSSVNFQLPGHCLCNDRRVGYRVGRPCQRCFVKRSLGQQSDIVAHKSQGAICRIPSNPYGVRSTTGEKSDGSVRQQNSGGLHTEPGWNQIYSSDRPNIKNFGAGQHKPDRDISLLYTRCLQRYCRQSLPSETSSGLASLQPRNRLTVQEMGNPRGRSFCHCFLKCCTELCQSRCKGQECSLHRCLQQNLGIQPGLDFPSTSPDSTCAVSFEQSQRQICPNSTKMGTSILESRFKTKNIGSSCSHSESGTSSMGRNTKCSSSGCPKLTLGSLVGTGWSSITSSWDAEDIKLLEGSWRKSTLKTYSAPWKAWVNRCIQKNLDPNQPDPADVAQYLCFLHREKGLAPCTIKLHKSVIAALANPLKRENITNHPLVKHVIRAIDNTLPPTVKKSIWDVEHLVLWMKNSVINEESLFEVSRHVALILLLASGRRIHDLTLLRVDEDYFELTEDSVTFWPVYGSKTDKNNYRQSGWHLSKGSSRNLDPVYWTKTLINLSAGRRQARTHLTNLFVSIRGVVKPASRALIAGWVKTAFVHLGIEFSPGSIRSAVASSRQAGNVPLDVILKNGNWKSDKNVFKFYFKEVIKNSTTTNTVCELVYSNFKPI